MVRGSVRGSPCARSVQEKDAGRYRPIGPKGPSYLQAQPQSMEDLPHWTDGATVIVIPKSRIARAAIHMSATLLEEFDRGYDSKILACIGKPGGFGR
ncbi:hypothetical protein E6H23_07915 [Candidatus Bathyarchaeota archaeon]|nr:MAG: hypothetical protein E6H23_07915 [Candidatus Bathyarchaeota archaeon]